MHMHPPKLAGIEDYLVWSVLWRQYAIKAGYGTALTAELEAGADAAAQQRDQLVRADLILSLPHNLVLLADRHKTAKQLWDWLRHLHMFYLTEQEPQLAEAVRGLRMDPSKETGLQYVLRADNLCATLAACPGRRANEIERVVAMVNGLQLPREDPRWSEMRCFQEHFNKPTTASNFSEALCSFEREMQEDGMAAAQAAGGGM
jgi:hypothetical protein